VVGVSGGLYSNVADERGYGSVQGAYSAQHLQLGKNTAISWVLFSAMGIGHNICNIQSVDDRQAPNDMSTMKACVILIALHKT
jgi:hypothetical protein